MAASKVDRIALVRPERARSIQDLLVRMAQSGQIRGRVSEDQLLGVLDQVSLTFPRRCQGRGTRRQNRRTYLSNSRMTLVLIHFGIAFLLT